MDTLTKAEKRKLRKHNHAEVNANISMRLAPITAKTPTQKYFLQNNRGEVTVLHGCPGTGKTYLALYSALNDLREDQYKSVKIIRSSVAVRDAGFLPGSIKEKMAVYEAPYHSICGELYGRGDAYGILKQKNLVEFMSTTYTRGMTFNDCVVVVDEAQNTSKNELYTILTRFGQNCKMYLCGDDKQDDLTSKRYNEESGYMYFLDILRKMKTVNTIEFGIEDIVRSGFVRELLETKYRLDDENNSRHHGDKCSRLDIKI